jgi:hypothetical protein
MALTLAVPARHVERPHPELAHVTERLGSTGWSKWGISAADLQRDDLEDRVPDVERLHRRDLGFRPWAVPNGHVDGLIHDGTHLEGRRSREHSAVGPPEIDLAFDERHSPITHAAPTRALRRSQSQRSAHRATIR